MQYAKIWLSSKKVLKYQNPELLKINLKSILKILEFYIENLNAKNLCFD